ncbi:MAG: phosphoribosylformylglycinamidine synthase subunit PurL [bacterium]
MTDLYKSLGLSDAEFKKILKILGREPSVTELAMFSVEWSEHCGYPSSRKWLKNFPKTGKYECLVGEDSGGIVVGDLAIVFKMESHNHPSYVEPKQGAATGVGGIIRDIFTAGARPIACLDSLRFGSLEKKYNKYLLNGVVDGIQFYGNCVGVPTVGGEIYFDESYNGNCLVNVMCIGVAPRKNLMRAQAKGKGNAIMYVGASTGRDGIGGCSILASKEFQEGEEKRPTVQVGDPFTEKCLIEATLETLATGAVVGIKDMGAAGLTCATVEMAAAGGVGINMSLDNVPKRESDMEPWEIMMSESQERMIVCVQKGREKEVEDIFKKWDLNAAIIGHVTDTKKVVIKDNGKVVADIDAEELTDPPVYNLPFKEPENHFNTQNLNLKKVSEKKDYSKVLLKLLASPNITNKSWVYEQYDHMVQTNTVELPGSDAAVLRLKGTNKAIAATSDCNGRYCFLNPYKGAQIAVAEACRNLVCSGAEPAGVTDCLNFGNPHKEDRFWQFVNSVKGITDACVKFNLPVVSGNVSFYNESPKGAIYPTPTIGMIGVIDDISKRCSSYFKEDGNDIILIGETREELGGSEYLSVIHGLVGGDAPYLDLNLEKQLQKTMLELIHKGLINSAHDCSEGGLAVAVAESCISRRDNLIGAVIDNLEPLERKDALLFGESQGRIIISSNKKNTPEVKEILKKASMPFMVIGKTGGSKFEIFSGKKKLIQLPLNIIASSWYNSLINV